MIFMNLVSNSFQSLILDPTLKVRYAGRKKQYLKARGEINGTNGYTLLALFKVLANLWPLGLSYYSRNTSVTNENTSTAMCN